MKIALVTGGAGFIGSHLSCRLLSEGWKVVIIDNLSTGFRTNIPAKAEFIKIDLSKDGFIKKLPRLRYDVVLHLAAQSSGEISFDDPLYDAKTNCLSTVALLNWCCQRRIRRFIYTSSMSIYGDQGDKAVKETAIAKPKSFYGIGKMASERYIQIYSKLGLDTTVLRLFNVFGPGQNMQNMRQGMVSIYMAHILKKEKIIIKGSPERFRDFIYIDDVVEAYLSCLSKPVTFGKIYNIGTGKKTKVKELIDHELKVFGYDPKSYPMQFAPSTPGDTMGIFADIKAIQRDTGWRPKVNLDKGLNFMVKWCLGQNINLKRKGF